MANFRKRHDNKQAFQPEQRKGISSKSLDDNTEVSASSFEKYGKTVKSQDNEFHNWTKKWDSMNAVEQVTILQNLDMVLIMNKRNGVPTTDMNGILVDNKPRMFSDLSPTTRRIIKNWYNDKLL